MDNLSGINTLETNFKAEVVAATLIEDGLEPEKILIYRHKSNEKDVSKDIDKLRCQYSDFDIMEFLYVYTNRESIYDSLPEGLFHQTSSSARTKTKEDIIHEIKDQRDKECMIRRYFQPFEMVLDSILIETQVYEQKYDKVFFYENLTNVIKEHWNILQYLSTGQALFLIKTIPIIAEASRDLSLTAGIISIILDCPVTIKNGEKSRLKLETEDCIKLGNWKLGINSVLGNTTEYTNPDLIINIGPLNLEQMRLFESNQNNDLILKELINMLIPFNRNTLVKYQTNKAESKFRLSGEGHTAYLGINTTL